MDSAVVVLVSFCFIFELIKYSMEDGQKSKLTGSEATTRANGQLNEALN